MIKTLPLIAGTTQLKATVTPKYVYTLMSLSHNNEPPWWGKDQPNIDPSHDPHTEHHNWHHCLTRRLSTPLPHDESTDEPPEDDTDSNQKTKPDEDDGFEEARKYLTGQTEYSDEVILDTLEGIREIESNIRNRDRGTRPEILRLDDIYKSAIGDPADDHEENMGYDNIPELGDEDRLYYGYLGPEAEIPDPEDTFSWYSPDVDGKWDKEKHFDALDPDNEEEFKKLLNNLVALYIHYYDDEREGGQPSAASGRSARFTAEALLRSDKDVNVVGNGYSTGGHGHIAFFTPHGAYAVDTTTNLMDVIGSDPYEGQYLDHYDLFSTQVTPEQVDGRDDLAARPWESRNFAPEIPAFGDDWDYRNPDWIYRPTLADGHWNDWVETVHEDTSFLKNQWRPLVASLASETAHLHLEFMEENIYDDEREGVLNLTAVIDPDLHDGIESLKDLPNVYEEYNGLENDGDVAEYFEDVVRPISRYEDIEDAPADSRF